MTQYKRATQQRHSRRWVPVVGLSLAVAVAIFAYFISFPLVEFGRERSETVDQSYHDLRAYFERYQWYRANESYHGNNVVEILVAVVLWLIIMGLGMLIVGVAAGTDPERKVLKEMGPSPANKKAYVKQLKRDLKELKRQERELKRQRK
ncbi:MAG: hypothetical protein Kow00106_07460 [Anaerolineae bacterium]